MRCILIKMFILVNLHMGRHMAMGFINGRMERNMMGSGKRESGMERECGRGWKGILILENGIRIGRRDMELILGHQGIDMMGSGCWGRSQAKDRISFQMATLIMDCILKENHQEWAFIHGVVEVYMRENLLKD